LYVDEWEKFIDWQSAVLAIVENVRRIRIIIVNCNTDLASQCFIKD
jgi:hypothetical protein